MHQLSYQVGDWVWLYKPVRCVGRSPKLQMSWHGPYQVVTILQEGLTYRIKLVNKPKYRQVVHHDRLKPCHPRREQEDDTEDVPSISAHRRDLEGGNDVDQRAGQDMSPSRNSEFQREDHEADGEGASEEDVHEVHTGVMMREHRTTSTDSTPEQSRM